MKEKLEARAADLRAKIAQADDAVAQTVMQKNLLQGALLEVMHMLNELTDASDVQQRPDESH